MLFGGTSATGEDKSSPASGSHPFEMEIEESTYNLLSDDHETPSRGIPNVELDEPDENGELMMSIRRKRPCPPWKKKDIRDDKLDATIAHILSSLDEKKNEGPTIVECMKSLTKMPNIQEKSSLYLYTLNAFRVKENREIWMMLHKDDVRIDWLEMNIEKEDRS